MVKNNKGMTMIEVLMGFTILILFLAGMSGIIAFSNNLVLRSVDLRKDSEVIQREMYKNGNKDNEKEFKLTFEPEIENIAVFGLEGVKVIEFDSEKMKKANPNIEISEEGLGLRYYCLEYDDKKK